MFQLMYYKRASNILTKDNLKAIQEVENKFLYNEEFSSKFCLLEASGNCTKPMSLIRFFDGTYKYASHVFDDPEFNNIQGVLNEARM